MTRRKAWTVRWFRRPDGGLTAARSADQAALYGRRKGYAPVDTDEAEAEVKSGAVAAAEKKRAEADRAAKERQVEEERLAKQRALQQAQGNVRGDGNG